MTSANFFEVLTLDSENIDVKKDFVPSKKDFVPSKKDFVPSKKDFVPSKKDFVPSKKDFVPSKKDFVPSKKMDIPKKVIIPDIQNQFPLIAIFWSGSTNNEFVVCKTKISSTLKLKKEVTLFDLNTKINQMEGLPYTCLVWSTTIHTPELKKMIENQYTLPAEYQHLHDLLCDDTIKSTKNQNVLILDFRRPYLKGSEYVYLKNHQQFFFGSVRESYLGRKSEVSGLKKYYDNFYRRFNFSEVEKIVIECHKFSLSSDDSAWIEYREKQFRLLKDAATIFELSDGKIFKRFPSFEDLKKEIDLVLLYKKELNEMLPKLKLKYDRKMIVQEINNPEAFPSL